MYKINPLKYTGVTVLPSEIAEKHLKLASEAQLKVIISAFSKANSPFDVNEISESTGIPLEEVTDALSYWQDTGFILRSDEIFTLTDKNDAVDEKVTAEEEIKPKQTKSNSLPSNNPSKLKYDEICIRIGESEEIRILLNEAQLKLGRTIGTGDQSSLILLHDYYGLPIEVILCICEYAGTKGKSTNMNYIYKIGVDWSQREIDNIEAADEELKRIEKTNSVWAIFCKEADIKNKIPNSSQEKYVSQWINEWNFTVAMLMLAYEEMITHTGKFSFSYMHKILSSWHKKGINTPEKAEEEKQNFIRENERKALERNNQKKNTKEELKPDPNTSYDLLRAEEIARKSVPKVKKRERR